MLNQGIDVRFHILTKCLEDSVILLKKEEGVITQECHYDNTITFLNSKVNYLITLFRLNSKKDYLNSEVDHPNCLAYYPDNAILEAWGFIVSIHLNLISCCYRILI